MKKKIRCSTRFVNLCLHTGKKKVQAAEFDADAFRQKHRDAANRRKSKEASKKAAEDVIYQIRESEKPIETAFELLVPPSGNADTVAGELIRAMMKILYRDSNDGDLFYEGYGIETCADAVAFICKKLPDLEDEFAKIAERTLKEEEYTKAIQDIADDLLEYIYEDLDLITTENTEDMLDSDGEKFIEDRDWEPLYDFECDIPYSVEAHVDASNIDYNDIQSELEWWDYLRDADVEVGQGYVSITGIKADALDEIESSLYDWLEQYGEALDNEYGVPGEDEEECLK